MLLVQCASLSRLLCSCWKSHAFNRSINNVPIGVPYLYKVPGQNLEPDLGGVDECPAARQPGSVGAHLRRVNLGYVCTIRYLDVST